MVQQTVVCPSLSRNTTRQRMIDVDHDLMDLSAVEKPNLTVKDSSLLDSSYGTFGHSITVVPENRTSGYSITVATEQIGGYALS